MAKAILVKARKAEVTGIDLDRSVVAGAEAVLARGRKGPAAEVYGGEFQHIDRDTDAYMWDGHELHHPDDFDVAVLVASADPSQPGLNNGNSPEPWMLPGNLVASLVRRTPQTVVDAPSYLGVGGSPLVRTSIRLEGRQVTEVSKYVQPVPPDDGLRRRLDFMARQFPDAVVVVDRNTETTFGRLFTSPGFNANDFVGTRPRRLSIPRQVIRIA